ncbi:MAG: carboxypeptidase-like regulatory domain-containing protein [Nitrososphaerota archaeon]
MTARDALDVGIVTRPLFTFKKFELKGGAIIPYLPLRVEGWMIGHRTLDVLEGLGSYMRFMSDLGIPVLLGSFRSDSPYDIGSYLDAVKRDYYLPTGHMELFIYERPPVERGELQYLLFSDLRPDLYFCGYAYRWENSGEEVFIPNFVQGNGSFPAIRPDGWRARFIGCNYDWGPYLYRAPEFRFYEEPTAFGVDDEGRSYTEGVYVIVGVPASEKVLYDSGSARRVFTGRWLVNGSVWPGPYLDLDVIGWPVGDNRPTRWPRVDGGCDPGVVLCPVKTLYHFRLTGPNGGMLELDGFTRRYRGYVREPWALGVTVLRLNGNTTAEPLYEREYLVNFTVPDGFRVLDGNATGWYREGSRIILPRLSELQISRGTKLVHEGWRDGSGRVYRPGEEVVVDAPRSFEPVLVRHHLVSVKGPEELRHSGAGWYRENSTAVLRVLENVTYVSDMTRYVFLGFAANGSVVQELRLTVTAPFEAEAVWRREHKLTVSSRFLEWSFENPWFVENRTYMMVIPGDPHNFGNGTLVQIKGVVVRSGAVIYNASLIELNVINLTVSGRRLTVLWNATFTVHGPPEMSVLWSVRYALDVMAPAGVASIRNSTLPLPATVFVEEGERIALDFKSSHLTGNATRIVLHDVIVDNRSLGPVPSVEIEVKRPVSVLAVYRYQVLVWPRLSGPDGSVADPDVVVLRSELGEVVSEGGKAVWLDRRVGVRSVEWTAVRAVYRGVDVTVSSTVRPGEPGTLLVPASISDLVVYVRDLLGMPVPSAAVSYRGAAGELTVRTDHSGLARLGVVPQGTARISASLIGGSDSEVTVPPARQEVVLPVSPYTIALMASAIFPLLVVSRRWRRGS